MATGVKPRNEDSQITRQDLEALEDAMKDKKFRDLLSEYCQEVSDPANQAIYQKEMTQLEKERGYDITFINPKGGYVIKTSVAGDRKAFINICSNDNVGKPSCSVKVVEGQKGMSWKIPYSLVPPRNDYDKKKVHCVIYDVVFHPDTLRMAQVNKRFRDLVNKTALDALKDTYEINLDHNNCRFPKSHYKGMVTPAVIRKEDPEYLPPSDEDVDCMTPDLIEKLYPQRIYNDKVDSNTDTTKEKKFKTKLNQSTPVCNNTDYTAPKYVIKQQKNIDLQDFTYEKNNKQYCTVPSHIVVEINMPLLSSTTDCVLDVREKSLSLISEKPAKYKLDLTLPYSVNEKCGNAKFDKSKHLLIVTLPVLRTNSSVNYAKVDSGVESEECSASQSDEDTPNQKLVTEICSVDSPDQESLAQNSELIKENSFLDPYLSYNLPSHTHNILDNMVAFTFHVKNTDPNSVLVKTTVNTLHIKFTSIGSGFVPVHYSAFLALDEGVTFENVSGEAWDNNVILQFELDGKMLEKYQIGIDEENMTCEYVNKLLSDSAHQNLPLLKTDFTAVIQVPNVEVSSLGQETNITVSSNEIDLEGKETEECLSSIDNKEKEITSPDTTPSEGGAKGILRKSMSMVRSYSESSVGDVASSMDYISSDCIPEESSLKKTVRFNDVIARQFYRYNSSIEGQKRKNQRKKSKKRNQERRKSESEAEDEAVISSNMVGKVKLKSASKLRRDSGLADTSDAEVDNKKFSKDDSTNDTDTDDSETFIQNVKTQHKDKNSEKIDDTSTSSDTANCDNDNNQSNKDNTTNIKSAPITCDNLKHNTDFYESDKLNKGKYLEVKFKNDLIFDLDM